MGNALAIARLALSQKDAPVAGTAPADLTREQIQAEAIKAARRNNVDPALYLGLIEQESRFDPTAVSNRDARGSAQLKLAASREVGVNRDDPLENIEGGARYLSKQIKRFGLDGGLAAYNAGPGRVQAAGGKIPGIRQTQEYVPSVKRRAQRFRELLGGALGPSVAEAAEITATAPSGGSALQKAREAQASKGQRAPSSALDLAREAQAVKQSQNNLGFASSTAIIAALKETNTVDADREFSPEERQTMFEDFHKGLEDAISGNVHQSFPGRAVDRALDLAARTNVFLLEKLSTPEAAERARSNVFKFTTPSNEAYNLGVQVGLEQQEFGGRLVGKAARILPDLPFLGRAAFGRLPFLTRLPSLFTATEVLRPGADFESLTEAAKAGLLTEVTFGLAGRFSSALVPGSSIGHRLGRAGVTGTTAAGFNIGIGGSAEDALSDFLLFGTLSLHGKGRPGLGQVPIGERFQTLLGPRTQVKQGLAKLSINPFTGRPGQIETPVYRRIVDARDRFTIAKMEREHQAALEAADAFERLVQGPKAAKAVETFFRNTRVTEAEQRGLVNNPDWMRAYTHEGTEVGRPPVEPVVETRGGVPRSPLSERAEFPEPKQPEPNLLGQNEPIAFTIDKLAVRASELIERRIGEALERGIRGQAGKEVPAFEHPVDIVETRMGDVVRREYMEVLKAKARGLKVGKGLTQKLIESKASDMIEDAMRLDGRTVVESQSMKGALLPPAGEHTLGIEAFNSLSKADRQVILDLNPRALHELIAPRPPSVDQGTRFGPQGQEGAGIKALGQTQRLAGTPDIILARDPRTFKIFTTLDRGVDPARKFMLNRWMTVLVDELTAPRLRGIEIKGVEAGGRDLGAFSDVFKGRRIGELRRPLPVEQLRLIGRWLDGFAAAKAELAKPENALLLNKAVKLRTMLDEVATWAGLAPGMRISEYFPHIMKVRSEFAFDIPFDIKNMDPATRRTIDLNLRDTLGGLRRGEIVAIRNFIAGRTTLTDLGKTKKMTRARARANLQKVPGLLEKAQVVEGILNGVANTQGKKPRQFAKDYFNAVLRNTLTDTKLIDVATDIRAMVPKRVFNASLDMERMDLNPKFLEHNALDVLRIYLYGASRKIAWDRMGGQEIRMQLDGLKEQFPNNTLVRYTDEYLQNYLGRNKTQFNEGMEQFLRSRKSLQYLAGKDVKVLSAIARNLMAPLPIDRFSNAVRMLEFNAKIGGNFVTPFVNLTQPLFFAAPMLSTTKTGKHIPGLGEIRLARSALWFALPKFRQIRRYGIADGIFGDPTKFEFSDQTFEQIPPGLFTLLGKNTLRGLGLVFRGSEWNNRGLTYTAGYRARFSDLKADFKAGRITQAERINMARDFARDLVNNTQFRGGKVSTSLTFQNPAVAPFVQFKSFSVKAAEAVAQRMSFAEKVHFAALIMIVAGPEGIPILNNFFDEDEFPSIARAAGISLDDQFGISMFGIPRLQSREIGNFIMGPFPGDFTMRIADPLLQGEVMKALEGTTRLLPASAQLRRFANPENQGLAAFFGPQIAGNR